MRAMCRNSVSLSVALLIGVFLSFGCEKATEPKAEEPKMPLSNSRILNQVVIGSSNSYSNIYDLVDNGKGSFFFRGQLNNDRTLGKMGRSGVAVWTELSQARSLCPVPNNTIGLADAAIAVGAIDYDSDGYLDRGYVRLRGAGGTELSEVIAQGPGRKIWLNYVASIDSLHFVAVGGAHIGSSHDYPYIITFDLNPDSSLAITNEHIFENMEKQRFGEVVVDPAKTTANEFVCYAGTTKLNDAGGTASAAVNAVRGTKRGGGAFSIQWTVNIAQSSTLPIWISEMMLQGNALYVAGSADAEDKKSGDSYFDNGFIASVSSAGVLNWVKFANLSKYTENYNDIFVTPSTLYAAGVVANYVMTDTKREYGLGLLSLFDPATGSALYHFGFGSYDYQAGFQTVFVEGTKAYCAGTTNHPISGGTFQGWYAEIRCDALGAPGAVELPDLTPLGGELRNVRPPREDSRVRNTSGRR